MLQCHQVTLQVEPWEIFWKIVVEIGWKEREREHINPLSNAFIALSICPFSKYFSNISSKVLSAQGSDPLSRLT